MDNNGQDDKNSSDGKEKHKNINDLQALNAIGSIIARMHSASSVAALHDIINDAKNIKSDDPRIQDILEKVKEVVSRKELVAEKQLNSEQMQKALEELAELEKHRQREEEIIKYKIAAGLQIQKADSIYEEFKKKSAEYQDICLPLEEMIQVNAQGESIIDEQRIDENIFLHEEIGDRRQTFAELKEQKQEMAKMVKKVNKEKQRLDNIHTELTEKLKNNKLSFKQRKELEEEVKAHQVKLEESSNVVTAVQEIYDNITNKLGEFELIHNENRKKIDKLGKIIEKTKINLDPDKHKLLNTKHVLLKDQHEAIVNNKDIDAKDRDVRKEIRNKAATTKVAKNIINNLAKKTEQERANSKKYGVGKEMTDNKKRNNIRVNTKSLSI